MSTELLHAHLRGEHREKRDADCPACSKLPAPPPAGRVSQGGQTPAHGNTTRPLTGRTCGCGCGEPVRRRFLPGHDAKLKSRLVREARDGSSAALEELRRYGWEHFV